MKTCIFIKCNLSIVQLVLPVVYEAPGGGIKCVDNTYFTKCLKH